MAGCFRSYMEELSDGGESMTEEMGLRLTEVEQKLNAGIDRLGRVESRQEALNKLTTAVEVLAQRQKTAEDDTREIKEDVKSLKERPGRHWENMVDRVLYLLLGAAFSLLSISAAG